MVFVHGLWMTGIDMLLLRRRLRRCGFAVRQFSYPSMRADVKANAERLQRFICSLDADTIHLVGHSLGGLVIRQFLDDSYGIEMRQQVGRIVTLGAPHNGSIVARQLATIPILRYLLGRSFDHGLDGELPPWNSAYELGVIAGTMNVGVGRLVPALSGESDGTVALAETRLEAMADHITVPASHTAMLFSTAVARQVCAFLHNGRFEH